MTSINTTIGIDVGGVKKGFHAVANKGRQYLGKLHSTDPEVIATWALNHQPSVIAIDAPCMFSEHGRSRKPERDLVENGMRCFYTPSRDLAAKSRFYDWVFNAERLYQKIGLPIFMGNQTTTPCIIETFPHAIQMSLWKNDSSLAPEGSKSTVRRTTLVQKADYNISHLSNIDFIDAALCAVSADYFDSHQFNAYGCANEGFIILPKIALK
jgi:predicted nuclease with RNAse H fold